MHSEIDNMIHVLNEYPLRDLQCSCGFGVNIRRAARLANTGFNYSVGVTGINNLKVKSDKRWIENVYGKYDK